jgi:hypothetical protein
LPVKEPVAAFHAQFLLLKNERFLHFTTCSLQFVAIDSRLSYANPTVHSHETHTHQGHIMKSLQILSAAVLIASSLTTQAMEIRRAEPMVIVGKRIPAKPAAQVRKAEPMVIVARRQAAPEVTIVLAKRGN